MLKIQLGLFRQLSSSNQGFAMAEVLVSILIATAFLLGTLQALALQAIVKVRAEREAQATFWIQNDIESVKVAAADVIDDDSFSRCNATTYANGFAYKLRDNLFNNQDGKGTGLGDTVPKYTNPDETTTNPNIQIAPSRKLVNKPYRLVRLISPDPNNLNVLKITYRVGLPETGTTEKSNANKLTDTTDPTDAAKINSIDQLQDDTSKEISIIAEQYVEVVPDGALRC